ncbi:transporter substrate-binding domain-containing protein [Pseudodesulfovibrio sp. JC047]|uniref:transporter substrate-binding domain-containing protein n=1 Tax=Pseudodesulfovibrio sp. JC047 TaxID=2683199 RepID=UPI0013D40445|nr:transporter substrate-binding domain-containing protein [Pseudodesulfovibrio sp. JC047]NDV19933.1 transporter substrate-binding domain-containing protein [Pseudodesulfovibrio sp. JC047]
MLITVLDAAATAKDMAWYRDHGVTVVNPPNSAPLSFLGINGTPKGYLIDIWKKWSEKTAIPVHFEFAQWDKTLTGVAQGTYDIHGGLFMSETRSAFLDFCIPFHEIQSALLVTKNNDVALSRLYSTFTVGVLKKGYTEDFIRKAHPTLKVSQFTAISDMRHALANETIQAAAGNHPILGFELRKLEKGQDILVKQILFKRNIHGAVAKGNTPLLTVVDQGFSDITPAEYKNIANHWFVLQTRKIDWFRYALTAGAILFIATMIAVLLGRGSISEHHSAD